jgi:iodotyrosine deiodinase
MTDPTDRYRPLPWPGLPDYPADEMIARARAFRASIETRRTCRFFSDAPVPREVIEEAILAAGTAPSGANHQPWHFAVISTPAVKRRLREAAEAEERAFYAGMAGSEWLEALAPLGTDADKPYLETAPWHIVVFGQRKGGIEPGDRKQNYYVTESVGIACGFLLLALHAAGLATLTHTPNPMGFLNRLCGRPAHEKAAMVIVAGKPAADATIPEHALLKKPLDRISSWL